MTQLREAGSLTERARSTRCWVCVETAVQTAYEGRCGAPGGRLHNQTVAQITLRIHLQFGKE
eukprot:12937123-Prorocentrum_lima.AAC.1